jgi:hypothetical protein
MLACLSMSDVLIQGPGLDPIWWTSSEKWRPQKRPQQWRRRRDSAKRSPEFPWQRDCVLAPRGFAARGFDAAISRGISRKKAYGIRTRVLALKGCHTLERITAEQCSACESSRLAGQMSVTLLHALSRSDYLKRSQKRPQQSTDHSREERSLQAYRGGACGGRDIAKRCGVVREQPR